MALSANAKYRERLAPAEFAYVPAAGVTIFEGALVALNSAGTLQPIQTSGSLVAVGLADGARNNNPSGNDIRPVRVRRGTWALTVAGATAANVGATVYATDDATLGLGGYAATAVAGGSNHGNGTFTTGPTAGTGAKPGAYVLSFTGATAFTIADPNGDALPAGAALAGYSDAALSFSITAGTNAFQAGDSFTITVAETGGGLAIGMLAGIESGQTYVKLNG